MLTSHHLFPFSRSIFPKLLLCFQKPYYSSLLVPLRSFVETRGGERERRGRERGMETLRSFVALFALSVFMASMASSEAYFFYVGGRDGWVLNPSESYSHWAERNRFQVNDSLGMCRSKPSSYISCVFFA